MHNEWKYGEFGHTSLRKTFVRIAQLGWDMNKFHHTSRKHMKNSQNGWKFKEVGITFQGKASKVVYVMDENMKNMFATIFQGKHVW